MEIRQNKKEEEETEKEKKRKCWSCFSAVTLIYIRATRTQYRITFTIHCIILCALSIYHSGRGVRCTYGIEFVPLELLLLVVVVVLLLFSVSGQKGIKSEKKEVRERA